MGFWDLLFGNSPRKKKRYLGSMYVGNLRCPRCGGTRFSHSELNSGEDGDSLDEFSDVCLRCKFRIQHDIYGRPLRYRKGKKHIVRKIIYKKRVRYFKTRRSHR
jgi:hypothetical protein